MTNTFRYVGIGKEVAFGTAVAGSVFLEQSSCTLDHPANSEILIGGGLGRMISRKRPGFYSCAGGIDYDIDVSSIGYLWRGVLDQYQYTLGEKLHEFYGGNSNELTSWTYRVGKDVKEFVYDGCTVNTLDLSVSGGLVSASVGLFARKDTPATIQSYSAFSSYIPTAYPLAFYEVTAEVNSSDVSADCTGLKLTVNNNLKRESGRALGSMYPSGFKAGDRVVEAQITLQFEDMDMMNLFWGDSGGPDCNGSDLFPLLLNFDGGDYGEMVISLPNCAMISAPIQPKGADPLFQTITCRALKQTSFALNDASTVDTDIYVALTNEGATLA
jgi:Phage tail tube protein